MQGVPRARSSDERLGDFVQHEVTSKIHRSDQHQQKPTIISGNDGVVGMLMVQRQTLIVRDEECSTTKHHYRNVGLVDLCVDEGVLRSIRILSKISTDDPAIQGEV